MLEGLLVVEGETFEPVLEQFEVGDVEGFEVFYAVEDFDEG